MCCFCRLFMTGYGRTCPGADWCGILCLEDSTHFLSSPVTSPSSPSITRHSVSVCVCVCARLHHLQLNAVKLCCSENEIITQIDVGFPLSSVCVCNLQVDHRHICPLYSFLNLACVCLHAHIGVCSGFVPGLHMSAVNLCCRSDGWSILCCQRRC